jgi:hypothetical protein
MKKLYKLTILAFLCCSAFACDKEEGPDVTCGTFLGQTAYKESTGNCYYKKADGTKEYIGNQNCPC